MVGLPPPRCSGGEPSHRDQTRQGMLTKFNIRKPGQVLVVLAAFASLSGLAKAQQSGLLPLHAIKRERTPCANEDPIYKLYRNQYYGYFPTQWRKFPDHWSLRNSETPDVAKELKEKPIEAPKGFSGEGDMEEPQGPGPGPGQGAKPTIPNPPPDTERSPFDMDKPDNGGAAPATRRPPAARGNQPPPPGDSSPFDVPDTNAPAPGAMPDGRPQASRSSRTSAPSLPDPGTPELAPPGDAPAPPPRTSWNRRNNEARQKDPGPLLSMSDATLPAVEESSTSANTADNMAESAVTNPNAAADPSTATAATQPPPRRGPISSLFAGLGLNWLRK